VCFGRGPASGVTVSDGGTRLTAIAPAGTGTVQVVVGTARGVSRGRPFSFTGSAIGAEAVPSARCAGLAAASRALPSSGTSSPGAASPSVSPESSP
jgi:hypothetical protein